MGEGTLVTFLLPAVHHAGSVDLYGSWDNFSTPYPMQKDMQMGHGHWYGCPEFRNVICDGEVSNCTMPEDRPLKMGGTYWYYYKRDGHREFHNPNQLSTTSCPLLPGQRVNELYVPRLATSAFLTADDGSNTVPGLTMDVNQRWKTPQPPKKPKRKSSTEQATMLKTREMWFSQVLGRLQTAVTEHVVAGFKAVDVDVQKRPLRPLPHRRNRTADGPGFIHSGTVDLKQLTRPATQPSPPVTSHERPQSRMGTLDVRPRSSRIFANPFEEGLDRNLLTIPESVAASTRPQTWSQIDDESSVDADEQLLTRPISAPHLKAAKSDLVTSFKLPQRSRTQIYRTNPNNRWRRGQLFIEGVSRPTSISTTPQFPPADNHHLEKGVLDAPPNTSTLYSSQPREDDVFDCDLSHKLDDFHLSELDIPSSLDLDLLNKSIESLDISPSKHTKYDSKNDIWTPATSPSKNVSCITSVAPSKRSSSTQLLSQLPYSPAMSPPTSFADQDSLRNNNPSKKLSEVHPGEIDGSKIERNPAFFASQETIRPIPSTQTASQSSSFSLGKLPFEADEMEIEGFNDLDFLSSAIL